MSTTTTTHPKRKNHAKIAAVSGFIGSALEYYDFFIYIAAAALIFPAIFFPEGEPGMSTLLAFGTVGVAYIARPFGAIFWGHVGDTFGRKRALLWCLMVMGVATFLVGCLPTFDAAGWWAPILLVVLRLIQGVSAGGESPGSSTLTLEHAPDNRRAFFTSWTMSGIMFGIVISSVVFIPIAALPEADLESWGWRIPFLASAIVTVVAIVLRRMLEEPEAFEEVKAHGDDAKIPVLSLLQHDGVTVIRVTLMALFTAINTMFNAFILGYATNTVGLPRTDILVIISVANFVAVWVGPLMGIVADKIGRKPVFLTGLGLQAVTIWALFAAVDAGDMTMIWVLGLFLIGFAYTMSNAVYPAYFPEQFPARVRFSGMAISLMLGLVMAGFSPTIAQSFVTGAGNERNWPAVAIFTIAIVVISGIAAAFAPETYKTPTWKLGLKRAQLDEIDRREHEGEALTQSITTTPYDHMGEQPKR